MKKFILYITVSDNYLTELINLPEIDTAEFATPTPIFPYNCGQPRGPGWRVSVYKEWYYIIQKEGIPDKVGGIQTSRTLRTRGLMWWRTRGMHDGFVSVLDAEIFAVGGEDCLKEGHTPTTLPERQDEI